MKSSMALGVPSWKSSSLACRLTVYLEVDFQARKSKGKAAVTAGKNPSGGWWGKYALQRKGSHTE